MSNNKRIAKAYNNAADWYDDNHFEQLEQKKPYLSLVSTHLAATNDAIILDLGCGTGLPIAQFFINSGYHVTGVDISKNMIKKCQTRFPSQEWIIADMTQLSLMKTFNAIIMWDSFFHLTPDKQKNMFSVLRKHCANNALLVFNSGTTNGESYSNWAGQDFYHASLDIKEYDQLLKINNFMILRRDLYEVGTMAIWVATFQEA